jgi:hypothetical protein
MRLLAHPACLDRPHQGTPRYARGQVGKVVFALARGAPLTHQPHLVARQMPVVAPGLAITHPHPQGRKASRQPTLRTLSPCHAPPGQRGQHVFGRTRLLVGNRLARPPRGRDELHVDAIDLLIAGNPNRPAQATSVEALAEGRAGAVASIGQHRAEAHTCLVQAIKFSQGDLTFTPDRPVGFRDACLRATCRLARPFLGQEQAQGDWHGHLVLRQSERDQALTVGLLAQRTAVLAGHTDREQTLLGQPRVVDDQTGLRPTHQPVRLAGQFGPERPVIPGGAGDEVLQLIVPG